MEIKRFFANQTALNDGIIVIDGDEYIHMSKVLRHKIGYKIIVNLEDGKDYFCEIISMNKDNCQAKVESIKDNECKSSNSITLFQALPKGDKIDLIIQKAVELGVKNIVPFYSQYVNEKKFNLDRANKIADEACKQCGRAIKCKVADVVEFSKILQIIEAYDLVIMPYENCTCGSVKNIETLKSAKNIAVIIGSEGGFDQQEAEAIKQVGGHIVSLGKRILRCETASIVAITLLQYELGELSQ